MPSHLIIGDTEKSRQAAQSLAPFPIEPSPDCYCVPPEGSLKIADVRAVKQFLTRRPYGHDHQIIYIPAADRLTLPAQNALLKTLEEPPDSAMIILTTGFPDRLLPTVTSRCFIHHLAATTATKNSSDAFLPIYQEVSAQTDGRRMLLAQTYAYPKTRAVTTCQNAIRFFRHQLHRENLGSAAQNAALAQKMLHYLESNVDPKLCLEHLFLHLV